MPKYMEDFKVGDIFRSPLRLFTEAEIIQFASRYDQQAAHTDPQAAEATFFKGLAASGWHTASAVFQLILDSEIDLAGGVIGTGIENLQWIKPVRVNDRLHAISEITAITPSEKNPKRGILTVKTVAYNQAEEPVLSLIGKLMTSARPAA